jgi:hypothetical protein
VDPYCFDADPDPDPAQNLHPDPDPEPDVGGGGGRSAKNVHPPWQNPRYAPGLLVPPSLVKNQSSRIEQQHSCVSWNTITYLSREIIPFVLAFLTLRSVESIHPVVQPETVENIWNLRGILTNSYFKIKLRVTSE